MKLFNRRWPLAVLAVLALAAILLAVLHTPMVRRYALERGFAFLEDRGVVGRAERLEYSLVGLSARLTGLVLAARGHEDTPFLEADEVFVEFPWRTVLRRIIEWDAIELSGVRVHIERDEEGRSNLPVLGEPDPDAQPAERVPIGPIAIDNLSLAWIDREHDLEIRLRGFDMRLEGDPADIAGPFSVTEPVQVTWEGRETAITTLAGRLSFDGRDLGLEGVRIELPEAGVDVEGRIAAVPSEPVLDLDWSADADLERLTPWFAPDEPLSGGIRASGHATGPVASPEVSFTAASDAIAWDDLEVADVSARGRLVGEDIRLERVEAGLAGGHVTASGLVPFAAGDLTTLEASWTDLDLATLLALVQDDGGFVEGRLEGDAKIAWRRDDLTSFEGRVDHTVRAAPPRRGPGIAGRAELTAADGAWRLTGRHEVGGAVTVDHQWQGRFDPESLTDSALGGTARATIPDAGALWRRVLVPLADLEPDDPQIAGSLAADLRFAGTLGAPRISGQVSGTDLFVEDAGPAALEAQVTLDGQFLTVPAATITIGENLVEAEARLSFETRAVSATLHAALDDLAALAPMVDERWRPTAGAAIVDAEVGGTLDALAVRAAVEARDIEAAGQRIDEIVARVRLEDDWLLVDDLRLARNDGRLQAEGRYGFERGQYAVALDAAGLRLSPVPPAEPDGEPLEVAGELNLRFRGEGTLEEPHGIGRLVVSDLFWEERELGRLNADFTLDGRQLVVVASAPRWRTEGRAAVDLQEPRTFRVDARTDRGDVAQLVEVATGEPWLIAGEIDLAVHVEGLVDDPASLELEAWLEDADLAVRQTFLRLVEPSVIRYTGDELQIDRLQLRMGGSLLTATGRLPREAPGTLAVALEGDLFDLHDLAELALEETDVRIDVLRGPVDLRVGITGTLDRPDVEATLQVADGTAAIGDFPAIDDLNLDAVLSEGVLELRRLAASWQQTVLAATGRFPAALMREQLPEGYVATLPPTPGPARLDLRVEELTPEALAPWVDRETLGQMAGRMTIAASIEAEEASLEALEGAIVFEESELVLAGVPLNQIEPTRLTIAGGRVRIDAWHWGGAGNRLMLAGSAALTGERELDLTVDGAIDLQILTAFLPGMATGGEATLAAAVGGTADEPEVDGRVTLARGELRMAEPRLAVTDLTGEIDLEADRLVVRELTGTANGGPLRITGELLYPGFELQEGALAVTVRGLAMDWPEGIRSEANVDVTLRIADGVPSLVGEVAVLRGAYREPLSLTAGLLAALRQQTVALPPPGPPGFVDQIRFDVTVRTVEDFYVDNNVARLELGGDLRLIGTVAQPALAGRAAIREGGTIFLGGRTYRIDTGTIDFVDPARIVPDLNITALTRVAGYEISLTLTGTPDALDTDLTSPSDPELTQADLVSLLVAGRRLAELDATGGAEVAREQLLGFFAGDLLGAAGRVLGLDEVRVESGFAREDLRFDAGLVATETDPGARLTIAKDISREVQLVLSQSLADQGLTWLAFYRPRRNLEARYILQDNLDAAYDFRHDVELGRGVTRPAADVVREDPWLITRVTFTGTPGFGDAELRRQVRLREGRRFDFFQWQNDRDRLLRFYRNAGYFEAHVSAGREVAEGEATLVYEIERGPRTVLTVEGYRPPGRLRDALEERWTRAIFDQFLLEDLAGAIRRHLAGRGYLRATIDAAIRMDPDLDRKEIVLDVDPGPRSPRREIRFAGNTEIGDARLEALIRDAGLRDTVWVAPGPLVESILTLYYSEGFLAAAVVVGDPEFENDRAILPVSIEEGPLFRVASVEVTGAAARLDAEVLRDFAIEEGSVYTETRVDAGRRRIETAYRGDGFNDIRVTVGRTFDTEAGRVDIDLRVAEGPRHILQDIVVDSLGRTHTQVIEQALRLEVGQPVDLASWFRARKRLHDTGVFRRADIEVEPLGDPVADAAVSTGGAALVQPVRARVRLEEWAPFRLRYGLQVTDTQPADQEARRRISPGATADFTHRNVLGRAATLGFSTRYSADQRAARSFLTAPTFLGRPITSNVFLARGQRVEGPADRRFVTDSSELTLEQRVRPGRLLEVSYGYSFQRTHTFPRVRTPDDPFEFDIRANVARLTSTAVMENRDDPFNATRGWFHSSSLEYAPEQLGSDLRFVRFFTQQFYYRPTRFGVVLASAGRLGLAGGFDQDLIPSERFFAGGRNTVRGYAEESLGPRDPFFGDAAGGNAMLVLNQEARFPIAGWVRGVGFLDAGNVFATVGDVSPRGLRVGTGFGLRIDTPFALVRVDYGVPVAPPAGQDRRGRFTISIGQMF